MCAEDWMAADKLERDWYRTEQDYDTAVKQAKDAANLFNAGREIYLHNGWPNLEVQAFRNEVCDFARQLNRESKGTAGYSEMLRAFARDMAI
jgi:hypothetical protein